MPKYNREKSKDEYKRQVNDLSYKAEDRTRHLNNVVKKDAKAVKELSSKFRSAGTIEGKKKVSEAIGQADKEIGKEFSRQQKDLERIITEGYRKKQEFEKGIRHSKLNYIELAKASNGIQESKAAHKNVSNAGKVSLQDMYTMNSLRDDIARILKRTSQRGRELSHEFGITGLYGSADSVNFYIDSESKRKKQHEINDAIEDVSKDSRLKNDNMEGQIIQKKDKDDKLCPQARKAIGYREARIRELEEKLHGVHLQGAKHVVEVPEKRKPNYGRHSIGQDNLYDQKDKYE